jgi:capsular exopolysaccharide synthesis family protein
MANVWDAIKKHQAEQARKTEAPKPAKTEPVGEAPPLPAPKPAPAPPAPPAPPVAVMGAPTPDPAATEEGANYSELIVSHHDRGSTITEEYRALRTSLLAQAPKERLCYLVTSAEAGEGKTVTSMNLAVVFTERAGRRTILVDCDLRRGRLASHFGAPASPGMAELLRGEVTLAEAIRPTVYPNLSIIPAGAAVHRDVGELFGRPEMDEIVHTLRRQYDFVIIDTPPINLVSDTGMLGPSVGKALLVIRMNRTRRESVEKAIRLLRSANIELDGLVLTHRKYYIPQYLYKYS